MEKALFKLLLLVSFFLTTHAQQSDFSPKNQTDFNSNDFKPHMLDHINKGCPNNSQCSKETGLKMQRWSKALRESKKLGIRRLTNTAKKVGIPFDLWSRAKTSKELKVITWDSSCPNHNLPDQQIFSATIFVKDIKDLMKFDDLVAPTLLLLKNKKIQQHYIPRDASPMFYDNGTIHYLMGNQGDYYGMKISSKGIISVNSIQKVSEYPQSKSCHPALMKKWKQTKAPKNLYKDVSCSSIWDAQAKKYIPILYGWTCHI
tara:strand:- start:25164 stop:25940 length:777 start_codon:yes stop_codon:yes gene_type:complete